jgi:hypothetical protein
MFSATMNSKTPPVVQERSGDRGWCRIITQTTGPG